LGSKAKDEYSRKDIFSLTAVILDVVLLPLLIIIGIVWLIIALS
jgi:hypothetical protein